MLLNKIQDIRRGVIIIVFREPGEWCVALRGGGSYILAVISIRARTFTILLSFAPVSLFWKLEGNRTTELLVLFPVNYNFAISYENIYTKGLTINF